MNEPQSQKTGDELRNTLKEVGVEIAKLLDHARGAAKDAAGDASRWAGKVVGHDPSPLDQIERLGELRDKGFVTDEEFQAKKVELLKKVG